VGMGLVRVVQVKIPVTDLAASASWYRALLDLDLTIEFVEQGTLRGVGLSDRDHGFRVSLRERNVCASRPHLDGFDPFAFQVDSEAALQRLVERCAQLGVSHGGIQGRGPFGAALDIPDPDGTVLRFLWEPVEFRDGFWGFEFGRNGAVELYDTPRISEQT
jgi:catechol-2,3-dioxygenase